MFKSVRSCPQQFDLPESKTRPFEKILINYENQLLSGVIFQVKFLLNCAAQLLFWNCVMFVGHYVYVSAV